MDISKYVVVFNTGFVNMKRLVTYLWMQCKFADCLEGIYK